MTQPIRGRRGDIVRGKDQWSGEQEILVWPDGHLETRGAYAYHLYYYLWNHQNVGIALQKGLVPRKFSKWALVRALDDPNVTENYGAYLPLGDLTNFLRHAEPTDNVLPAIREGMKSLLALKNIEVTNKNMPSNSSIPIRLRLAAHDSRLAPLDHPRQPVKQEEDEEIPF